MESVEFSIIIPVYNEEMRIQQNFFEIMNFFGTYAHSVEIIFVNDGSVDATQHVLESYQKKYSFKLIAYAQNKGKGYAIRQGVLQSVGQWIIFFDIDLATPLVEFFKLVQTLRSNDHVIIGSRRLNESLIKKPESNLRVFLGEGFTHLSNLLVPNITDFTCGFKCFSKQAAQKIFHRARINRWVFDAEILYIARLHNISIREMAVTWSHDDSSRVKILKDILISVRELIQIKYNQSRGLYN